MSMNPDPARVREAIQAWRADRAEREAPPNIAAAKARVANLKRAHDAKALPAQQEVARLRVELKSAERTIRTLALANERLRAALALHGRGYEWLLKETADRARRNGGGA